MEAGSAEVMIGVWEADYEEKDEERYGGNGVLGLSTRALRTVRTRLREEDEEKQTRIGEHLGGKRYT